MEKQKEIRFWFKPVGRNVLVEFEEYQRFTWAAKRLVPLKIRQAIKEITNLDLNPIFCRLADFGHKKDNFFKASIVIPTNWVKQARHTFKLQEVAKTST